MSHFTNFDYIVIAVMALSCIFAFYRGLVREILSLIAWVGAGVVTLYYFHDVAAKLAPHFKSPTMAAALATFGLYFAALIGFGLINMIIIKSIKSGGEAGALDNLLGLGFGAIRGALIISLGYFLLNVALPNKDDREEPEWLKGSVTKPYAEKGAALLAKAAPEYLDDISRLERQGVDKAREEPSPEEENNQNNGAGYSRQSNQQLNRLIESSSPSR